jgi:hypothetical protein
MAPEIVIDTERMDVENAVKSLLGLVDPSA